MMQPQTWLEKRSSQTPPGSSAKYMIQVLKSISKTLIVIVAKQGAHHVDLRFGGFDLEDFDLGFGRRCWRENGGQHRGRSRFCLRLRLRFLVSVMGWGFGFRREEGATISDNGSDERLSEVEGEKLREKAGEMAD
ncbi:hypothetical protein Fmac_011354 [Flemingia macrophylla]|uniref:Uncharacterized protein n=1 Tax=Flemingia macrophylla TaxID=520843 RepID=A0ABD1MM69_9FABA